VSTPGFGEAHGTGLFEQHGTLTLIVVIKLYPPVFVAPVMTATGEGLRLAPIDAQQRPEAIMLDLVNPAASPRRVSGEHGHLGRNERWHGRIARHGRLLGAQLGGVESSAG
jgi:hypothetical protein